MKTGRKHVMLCLISVLLSILPCSARISTSPIYINSPDSSVHAHVVSTVYECKPQMDRWYYWYNKNTILSSEGGFSGRLLHGSYTSYFHNHNIKSQGIFKRGLKQGIWVTWFSNGKIKERTKYSNGVADGASEQYDSAGHLTTRIYYRNGVRAGKTKIFRQDGTDSTIRYRNGVAVVPEIKTDSINRNERKVRKRVVQSDSTEKPTTDSIQIKRKRKKQDTIKPESAPKVNEKTKPGRKLRDLFSRKKFKVDNSPAHE